MTSAARLTHVNLARGYRGGERQTELLIRALAERGLAQRFIGRRGEPLMDRLADVAGLERIAIRKPFIARIHQLRTGLVHAHDGKGAHYAHAAYHVFGTPYVITRRVDNAPSQSRATRAMYRRAARVVVLSDAIGNVLKQRFGDVDTLRIPSAAADLAIDMARVAALRASWGGECIVGQIGALDDSQKGQFDTLAAARRLSADEPGWRVVLVGDGKDEAELKARAADLDGVVFTGRVDNVGDHLAAFDIFVFPSRHEGLGSTLLDAMQAGVPIVASDVDGIPEIIEHDVNGVLVPPGDPAALAEAVAALRADPERAMVLAQNGRDRAARYTVAAMAERYIALYKELGVTLDAMTHS